MHVSFWPVRHAILKKNVTSPKNVCVEDFKQIFSRQELDPPEAVDLETTAKIKVPSQITQPDVSNDQTTVSIAIIGRSRLSLLQSNLAKTRNI